VIPRQSWIALLTCALALMAASAYGEDAMNADALSDWQARIRPDHPRMFLNRETLPQVKAYVLAHEADFYAGVRRSVAAVPLRPDAAQCESGSTPKYGLYAQRCAFVWLMEGDRAALAKAKAYLKAGVEFYNRRSSARQTVNWYSASRVGALMAYDWIYGELTPGERQEIGQGFFRHVRDCLGGRRFDRQNRGDYKSGFYGPPNLPWYVGLAFYGDGIDDAEAERLVRKGFEDHMDLMDYRSQAAGDDGGMASLATGYAFGMYPWAEFNFMHTLSSATGIALEERFDHMSLFPNWVLWNWIPGGWRYGLADSAPAGRFGSGFLEMHMLQIAHFYARRYPDRARLAMWVRQNVLERREHDTLWWPLAPFFVTRCAELPGPDGPDARWPLARNFANMGVVFMRSGWAPTDTHAAFVAGGTISSHRHYDQGHFIIYRNGFLALDSGSYGPRERNEHLAEYFYRTVAHNSVLIYAPPEADRPAKIWGGEADTLDGGQYVQDGRQIAFETSDAYTYAATDATKCYAPAKCSEAVRQFVFVPPYHFVVCDRVTATDAGYAKAWLLHSAEEPQMLDDGFRVAERDGALVCCPIFPQDRQMKVVGGPGKEYWSAGKNRPQEGRHRSLSGSWRVEVSPGAPRERDVFVHLLRVGDAGLQDAGEYEPVEADGRVGVRFRTDAGYVTVAFNASGEVGGHITMDGPQKLDRPLTTAIQPQEGLAVANE